MRKICIALLIFLLPSIALAAGFAKQSIFLSTDSPTEGDSVFVYVVLANDTDQSFSGLLKIYDEDGTIGTTSVALAVGKAETAAIPWQPLAGVHALNAILETSDGMTTIESEDATFTVAPKPQTQAGGSSAFSDTGESAAGLPVQSSQPIEQSIANLSPTVARDSQPAFSAVDSARSTTAGVLDQGISWSQQQSTQKLNIASSTPEVGVLQSSWSITASGLAWLLSALRYGVANIGIFYPALALIFFFILWRVWRRMRRPRYLR